MERAAALTREAVALSELLRDAGFARPLEHEDSAEMAHAASEHWASSRSKIDWSNAPSFVRL